MKYKATSVKVQDVDSKTRRVKVAFASFGTKDAVDDIILRGAFAKSIAENGPRGTGRIKHFKNHDSRLVPAVIEELSETDTHLVAVSRLIDTTVGRDTLIEYEEQVIKEHSIGYSIIQSKNIEEDGKFVAQQLIELKLYEGSSLTAWGANADTPTLEVKALQDHMQKLDDLLHLKGFSDERFKAIELQLAKLTEIMTALQQGFEPLIKSTQELAQPRLIDSVIEAIRRA